MMGLNFLRVSQTFRKKTRYHGRVSIVGGVCRNCAAPHVSSFSMTEGWFDLGAETLERSVAALGWNPPFTAWINLGKPVTFQASTSLSV